MFLKNRITVVSINKGITPDNQRREQLALFQDIFFKLLKFIIGQRGIWDWNSGSIFRLIIRTLLYLSCCAGSSSRKKDATFCFAVFSLSSSSLASLYCS